MKIVFMGTPEFAVATLDAIYNAGYDIAAVVTAPDKPAGRGQQLHFSDVKKYALKHQLKILQPEKLKDPVFITQLKNLKADLFIVLAFRMLPKVIYSMPKFGTFNIHASLLPDYRGAAPIHWAVMNGETKTGVTSFFLNDEIDKGDIIGFREVPVGDKETTGELYDKLKDEGAILALDTIDKIVNGNFTLIRQKNVEEVNLKSAPKILKQDTLICWNSPAKEIFNKIRGLSPFPGAYTRIKDSQGKELVIKCFKTEISFEKASTPPGTVMVDEHRNCSISTQDFQILLLNLQLEGKKRMDIKEFMTGFRVENYTMFLF